MKKEQFQELLRLWQASNSLDNKKAAKRLGVNRRTYEGWIVGRRMPRGLALATVLKKTWDMKLEPQTKKAPRV